MGGRTDSIVKPTGPRDKTSKPGLDIDLATRTGRAKIQARQQALLDKEIRILGRLIANRPQNDPQRPEVLVRLAETQFEMQLARKAAVRSFDDPIHDACVVKKDQAACSAAKNGQKSAEKDLKDAQRDTVRTYATLVRDYPNYPRMDEVLFSLAFGLEETEDYDQARAVYHRLIKDYPKSRFIPHAYLSFAEYYFNVADLDSAAKFYNQVLRYPPERNSVYGFALYKLAWVEYNQERYDQSLKHFVAVLEFARSNPSAIDAKQLANQTKKELVLPYSYVGNPAKAYSFFMRFAKNEDEALELLENLADLYYDGGQWEKSDPTYHELMARRPKSDKLCEWQNRVTRAEIASNTKDVQVRELQRLSDIGKLFQKANKPADVVKACRSDGATLTYWLATSWHREAAGTDKQPGTHNKNTMKLAATLYNQLLADYPDMESLDYDTIDKRDWPNPYKIAYYQAELLWAAEDWERCGPAFDQLVSMNPRGDYAPDAAYAAVLCYNNLYKQQYAPRDKTKMGKARWYAKGDAAKDNAPAGKFAPRDFTPLEKGMLEAFSRYVCYVDQSDELVQIKYQRARIYYESNHIDEAALLFKDIAVNHSKSPLAEYAANLYLDCLNILGTQIEQPRAQCVNELVAAIDPMSEAYCRSPDSAQKFPDLCGSLDTLQCQARRKEAEVYEKAGQFKKAAATYVRIFKRNASCGDMDEVLYNAAIDFEAARLLGSAIQVRGVLIKYFPESPWSKRAMFLTAANYHALAYYETAADNYEAFAKRFPGEVGDRCTAKEKDAGTCANAVSSLQNALFFRIGLNDDQKALADAELFANNYRARLPRETSQAVFAVGALYERQARWADVAKHYQDYLKRYGNSAMPHQRVEANTLIGRALWNLNRKPDAKRYFAEAVRLWNAGAGRQIAQLKDVDDKEQMRYLREALDSAAEAQFYLAEFGYDDFKAIGFPKYSGQYSTASVNKWAKGVFQQWVKKKLDALKVAERQYNRIADMNVAAAGGEKVESAPWQIAAASRIGEMYRSFVDEFRDAPIPKDIEKDPELFDVYVGALDEQSEPLKKQAIDRFEFCLKTSTNVRWFNKWSRTCEQELHELNPSEYPLASELRDDADYEVETLGWPGPIELVTGQEGFDASKDSIDDAGKED